MGDLDACAAWAQAQGADASKLAVTGFCWGGRIVWLYAAHQPKLKAGVAWYGQLVPRQASELQPKAPIETAADLKAPVLGLYGEADQGIPVEHVERMRAALRQAGKQSEIIVYPAAPHGFHADYRPSYRKEAAEDGWKRMLEWFKRHGAG
jgi:carboxymethylenebutenolidase